MQSTDYDKIEEMAAERKKAHAFYYKNSDVYRSFVEMEAKTYDDRELQRRYKELIAVGISIVINCESSIEWHINEALKAGATKNQIIEAIEVGIEMGGGPATVSARFAQKVIEYYDQ